MPAKSASQKRLMDAAAHNPAFAKKVGIPTKVAKEYSKASKGMTFQKGGEMKESKAMAKKEVSFMQKKGAPKSMIKHEKAEYGLKKGGKVKGYMDGGTAGSGTMARNMALAKAAAPIAAARMTAAGMKKGGSVAPSKMGKVIAGGIKAHGEHTVQKKGHTKAKQVAMRKGGKC